MREHHVVPRVGAAVVPERAEHGTRLREPRRIGEVERVVVAAGCGRRLAVAAVAVAASVGVVAGGGRAVAVSSVAVVASVGVAAGGRAAAVSATSRVDDGAASIGVDAAAAVGVGVGAFVGPLRIRGGGLTSTSARHLAHSSVQRRRRGRRRRRRDDTAGRGASRRVGCWSGVGLGTSPEIAIDGGRSGARRGRSVNARRGRRTPRRRRRCGRKRCGRRSAGRGGESGRRGLARRRRRRRCARVRRSLLRRRRLRLLRLCALHKQALLLLRAALPVLKLALERGGARDRLGARAALRRELELVCDRGQDGTRRACDELVIHVRV